MSGTIELSLGNRNNIQITKKYTTSDRCELKNIFERLNDWRVIDLEASKSDKIDDSDLEKEILQGIKSRMSEIIIKSNYGAMRTDDPDTDDYYIFKWNSNGVV